MDVKIDEEKYGKEGSEDNGKVCSELNLKGNRVGGEGLDDGVHGEGGGGHDRGRDGSNGSLQANILDNCG